MGRQRIKIYTTYIHAGRFIHTHFDPQIARKHPHHCLAKIYIVVIGDPLRQNGAYPSNHYYCCRLEASSEQRIYILEKPSRDFQEIYISRERSRLFTALHPNRIKTIGSQFNSRRKTVQNYNNELSMVNRVSRVS